MKLGRIRQPNNDPPPIELGWQGHVIAAAQENLKREYARGLADGVRMTLDHIEGIAAGGVPYDGPIPDELRAYIARARKGLASEGSEQP